MKKIINLKDECHYSYTQISKMTGWSKAYVWQLLHDKRRINYKQAIILAHIFNMKPDKLFYDDCMEDNELTKILKQIDNFKKGK